MAASESCADLRSCGGNRALAFAIITYFEVLVGRTGAEVAGAAAGGADCPGGRGTYGCVHSHDAAGGEGDERVGDAGAAALFRAPLRGEGAVHSPEELKLIATATRRMGLLPAFQEEMIHRAIELNHVTVREIMTPRGKIFSLPSDMPVEQASARIVDEQHSRVPVFDPAGGPEQIIGVVYSKDILAADALPQRVAGVGRGGELGAAAAAGDARGASWFRRRSWRSNFCRSSRSGGGRSRL